MTVADRRQLLEAAMLPEKDGAVAAERWRVLVEAFPDDPDQPAWRARLAPALHRLGRLADARALYADLARRDPGKDTGLVGLAMTAAQSGDWAGALDAWDSVLARFADAEAAPRWRALRARALLGLGRAQEAHDALSALRGRADLTDIVAPAFAQACEKLGLWREAARVWREALAALPQAPHARAWRRFLALACERAGELREAGETWRALAEATGDAEARARAARCRFTLEGASAQTERWAREAAEVDPDPTRSLKLLAHVVGARGDMREAFALWTECARRAPDDLDAHAGAALAALRLGDPAAVLPEAPPALAATAEYRARALLPRLELSGDVKTGEDVAAALDPAALDDRALVATADFLTRNYRSETALRLIERAGERLQRNVAAVTLRLNALHMSGDAAAFEAAKASALAALPAADRLTVLARLSPRGLTVQEAGEVIDSAFDADPEAAANSSALLRLAFRGRDETLVRLHARLTQSPAPAAQLRGRLFLALIEERRRVARACLGGREWREWREARARLSEGVARVVNGGALDPKIAEPLADLARTAARARQDWTLTAESFCDASAFALWLRDRARRRLPTSVIRLGDGEGRFLPYAPAHAPRQRADIEAIERVWWRSPRLTGAQIAALSARFVRALEEADAIGAPPLGRLLTTPDPAASAEARGTLSALRFVERLDDHLTQTKALTSSHLHHDLEQWNLYPVFLTPEAVVSFVSCFDLANVLLRKFGVATRRQWCIPPEHFWAGVFGQDFDKERPFYPDIFEEILDQIDPRPGEIVLVAAGFLGKLICARVRERGGVGLDVGSIVDIWMGHDTRFYAGSFADAEPPPGLVAGNPLDALPDTPVARGDGPCLSDEGRRADVRARLPAPAPAGRWRLLVTGHPRAGSNYAASALSRLGLEIGHERPRRDGLCSWMHAVEDLNPPFRKPPALHAAFDVILAYVRDPARATASIVVENGSSGSFRFRRFHIRRACGVDIARYVDPIARALASYLHWMEIVARLNPLATLRVEHLLDDLDACGDALARAGVALDGSGRAAVAALPRTLNSSDARTDVAPPTLEADWRDRLPPELREGLSAFCARYGYA